MNNSVLFRASSLDQEEELEIAKKYFDVYRYRSQVPSNNQVIARYSALPYYYELVEDLRSKESHLLNSYQQHRWIADFEYYHQFIDVTPKTWWEREMPYCNHPGPFIVKGATNSRKHRWKTHMFAETKRDALLVACELVNDPLIARQQEIIYREYVPLKIFERCPISGLPFANEFRFFFYKEHLLTFGYYWSTAENAEHFKISQAGLEFAKKLAKRAAKHANFFVLDIAEKEDSPDEWILIEINDGQQSGLSLCNAEELYSNLQKALKDDKQ